MKEQLVKCLNQKYMQPLPKKKLNTPREMKVGIVDIEFLCCCPVPDVKGLGPWIACDGCDQWYLQRCDVVHCGHIVCFAIMRKKI